MTKLINVVGKVNSGAATKRVCKALAESYGATIRCCLEQGTSAGSRGARARRHENGLAAR
jgi:uncharacterized protein (DUF697 family)